jgi:hypothetical protein
MLENSFSLKLIGWVFISHLVIYTIPAVYELGEQMILRHLGSKIRRIFVYQQDFMTRPNNIDPLSFWKEYRRIGSTDSLPGRSIGPKVCRFCGNKEGLVSFRNQSHAISELLGRNQFLLFDECDSCNMRFSEWERHLSQFFMPFLAILGIRGKKDIREFRSRIENNIEGTRTSMKMDRKGNFKVKMNLTKDLQVDSIDKNITIAFRREPLSRLSVYKSLVKIALSLLPRNEVASHRELFDWLLDHNNSTVPCIPGACVTILKKVKWEKPVADLFESNRIEGQDDSELFPKFTLVLRFANLIVQIFLLPKKGTRVVENGLPSLELNYFPAFALDYAPEKASLAAQDPKTLIEIPIDLTWYDLSKEDLEESDEVINLKYQSTS